MLSSGSTRPRSMAMLKQMPVTPLATLIMQTVVCSSQARLRSARAQPPQRSTTVSPSITTEQAAPSASSSRKFSTKASATGAKRSLWRPRSGKAAPRASSVSLSSACAKSSPLVASLCDSCSGEARGAAAHKKVALIGMAGTCRLPELKLEIGDRPQFDALPRRRIRRCVRVLEGAVRGVLDGVRIAVEQLEDERFPRLHLRHPIPEVVRIVGEVEAPERAALEVAEAADDLAVEQVLTAHGARVAHRERRAFDHRDRAPDVDQHVPAGEAAFGLFGREQVAGEIGHSARTIVDVGTVGGLVVAVSAGGVGADHRAEADHL